MKKQCLFIAILMGAQCSHLAFSAPVIGFSDVFKQNKIQLMTPTINLQNPWNDSTVWGNFNTVSKAVIEKKKVNPWMGTSFYFGYAGTKGDSNNTNITMGSNVRYAFNEKMFNVFKFNYIFNSSQTAGITANNYTLSDYVIYSFDSYNGVYVMGNYYEDYFSGYNFTATESVGYRRMILNDKTQTLSALIGPAGVQRVALTPPAPGAPSYYYLAANGLINYKYNLSKTSNISETLGVVTGTTQTMSQSVTAITSKLTENMSMQINYAWTYNTAPATGKCRSNTQTTMAIIYGI